ncbi:RDD family protein [Halobium salinum]|uniref:RDD family protein n=1 Tax=Halobium salinum TaxID=1364940 RepID=A0ABD5PCG4_9EURY|nr:RDD family protein [Halobium salinum]
MSESPSSTSPTASTPPSSSVSSSSAAADRVHLVRRAAAVFVDTVVVAAVGGLLGGAISLTVPPELGTPSASVAVVAVFFAYFVLLEGLRGTTPGKQLFGLRVVRLDGGPCDLRAAAIRNVLRLVDWLPAGYLLGAVLLYVTDDTQRLGDLAAATVVVRADAQ